MNDLSSRFLTPPADWLPVDIAALPVLLAIGVVVALPYLRRRLTARRRHRSRPPRIRALSPHGQEAPGPRPKGRNMADVEAQLAAVAKVSFEKRRLLNMGEYDVFRLLERLVSQAGTGHRVMAQTSLGELIQPRPASADRAARKDAHASINSKRLDFAIVDRFGLLAVAVEYQGSGHYHHKTFMRDAVKREALRRAGVTLIEVPRKWDREVLAAQIGNVLHAAAADRGQAPAPA